MRRFHVLTALGFLLLFGVVEYAQAAAVRTLPHDHSTRGKGGALGEVEIVCLKSGGNCVIEATGNGGRVRGGLGASGESIVSWRWRDNDGNETLANIRIDELAGLFEITGQSTTITDIAIRHETAGSVLEDAYRSVLNGKVTLSYDANARIDTTLLGADIFGSILNLDSTAATLSRVVIFNSNRGVALSVAANGANTSLDQTSSDGVFQENWITMVSNGAVNQFNNGTLVTRTVGAASGGLEVNNTSTGGGFERVLTTADISAAGSFLTDSIASDLTITDATLAACLSVTTVANTNYSVEAHLSVSSPVADDFNVRFTLPASALSVGIGQNVQNTNFDWVDNSTVTYQAMATREGILMQGMLTTEGTAGTFSLDCAKNADAGADATLFEGSWLKLQVM